MQLSAKTRFKLRMQSRAFLLTSVAVFILLAWLSQRYVSVSDWTVNGRNSLSPVSIAALKELPDALQINVTAMESDARLREFNRLLGRYKHHKKNISVQFYQTQEILDERQPLDSNNGVDGNITFSYKQRSEQVNEVSEQDFTNALIRLSRSKQYVIAFTQGHGERLLRSKKGRDIELFSNELAANGYTVKELELGKNNDLLAKTNVVVIASAQKNFSDANASALLDYVKNGGNILWLLEPGSLHGLDALADELGFSLMPGTVVDLSTIAINRDPTMLYIEQMPPHEILQDISFVHLPVTAGLELATAYDWQNESLLMTNQGSWLETGDSEVPIFDEDEDIAGPITVAAVFYRDREGAAKSLQQFNKTKDKDWVALPEQRVVVSGDGDFLSNGFLHPNNLKLGMQMVRWLTQDEEFVVIQDIASADDRVILSETRYTVLQWMHLAIIPLLLIVSGVVI